MDDENLPQTEDLTHEFLRVDDLRKRKPATIGLVLQRSAFPERKRHHCDHSNCFSRLTEAGQQEVEQVPGASFNSPGRNPEHPRRREGINSPSPPPGDFVSETMVVAVIVRQSFSTTFLRCDYEELLDFNFSGLRASNGGPSTRDGICIDKCLYKYQIVFLGAGHGFCGF